MIAELLNTGAKNARTAAELADALRCTPREITAQIHRERLSGAPICSDGSGFYMPADIKDIERTAAHLKSRAKEILKIAESLEGIKWK